MRYRHIIWDWNGTIVDDVDLTVEITNLQLAEAGVPEISIEQHRAAFQIPIANYYREIGLPTTPETMPSIDRAYHDSYHEARHRLTLFSDLIPTMETMRTYQCGHSILSALPHELLGEHLVQVNLEGAFRKVIGRKTVHAESKVEAGRGLLKELNLGAADILVIGDTVYDHEVAHALGADCALIARGHQNLARLREAKPTFLVDSLAELLGHIVERRD